VGCQREREQNETGQTHLLKMLKEEVGERETVSTKEMWRAMEQYLVANIFTNIEDVVGLENMSNMSSQ